MTLKLLAPALVMFFCVSAASAQAPNAYWYYCSVPNKAGSATYFSDVFHYNGKSTPRDLRRDFVSYIAGSGHNEELNEEAGMCLMVSEERHGGAAEAQKQKDAVMEGLRKNGKGQGPNGADYKVIDTHWVHRDDYSG